MLLNLIDYGMEPQEAVNATRLHHQWLPDVTFHGALCTVRRHRAGTAGPGYTLVEQSPWGAAELIVIPAGRFGRRACLLGQ